MPFREPKPFIAVFALLALMGQALAGVNVSCAMADAGSPHAEHMADRHHAAHAMADSSRSDASPIDCCEDPLCSTLHCGGASTVGIAADARFDLSGTGVLPTGYALLHPAPEAVPLFRPPITR